MLMKKTEEDTKNGKHTVFMAESILLNCPYYSK
jgi:hypothetical protein